MAFKYKSKLNYDPNTPSPCDACRMQRGCAEHRLACPACMEYTAYGNTEKVPSIPLRICWEAMQNDSTPLSIRAHRQSRIFHERARKARAMRAAG